MAQQPRGMMLQKHGWQGSHFWHGHWWRPTEKGLWEKGRSGRQWGDITEDSYWEATMQTWERSTWNDRAPRSHTEVFAEAEQGCIAWMPNASAVGNARGDEDAVAFTDAHTVDSADEFRGGESVDEFQFRDGDSAISGDWLDADDAYAYALTETKRECEDSATAAIAESFFAAAKAMDDGATSEDSVSSLSSWGRFPQKTQAAGKSQHT